jgi:hypothetical protein
MAIPTDRMRWFTSGFHRKSLFMQFEIVERDETWVAGLPVRSPKRALGELRDRDLEAAWAAVLHQELGGPLASAYTDYTGELGTYNTQIVGYQCSSFAARRLRPVLLGR